MTSTLSTDISRADALHALADMLGNNGHLEPHLSDQRILCYIGYETDPKALMAAFARAGKASGARVEKGYDESWGSVSLHFGPLEVYVYAHRDAVCERIVVGTETVTKTVKDPKALAAVPEVEVTEEVEKVEWRCLPLLDEEQMPAVAAFPARGHKMLGVSS